jgi:hypothetical protein
MLGMMGAEIVASNSKAKPAMHNKTPSVAALNTAIFFQIIVVLNQLSKMAGRSGEAMCCGLDVPSRDYRSLRMPMGT